MSYIVIVFKLFLFLMKKCNLKFEIIKKNAYFYIPHWLLFGFVYFLYKVNIYITCLSIILIFNQVD